MADSALRQLVRDYFAARLRADRLEEHPNLYPDHKSWQKAADSAYRLLSDREQQLRRAVDEKVDPVQ